MSRFASARLNARKAFAQNEDGSFTILNMFLMMTVLFVAGIAVDAVRYEGRRTKVQNTLDRAILAAADMNQTRTPTQVVQDYFEAAGLMDYYAAPVVDDSHGYKSVSATATGELNTFFMNLLGINELPIISSGTAEESISDIEISLVLDISGSMNEEVTYQVYEQSRYNSRKYVWNTYSTGKTKIETLQDAAKEFVDTVFGSTSSARTSMTVVPYASEVVVPAEMWTKYNIPARHPYSRCVDFDAEDFNVPYISTSAPLHQTDHLDPFYRAMPPQLTVCSTDETDALLPLSGDPEAIKTMIGDLTAGGNTSIDVGLKWGIGLLDPAAQSVVSGLIDDDVVSADFEGRPYNYEDGQTMKVVVVMTDGHNTDQYELKSNYNEDDLSDIWKWTDSSGKVWYSVKKSEGSSKDLDGDGIKNEAYWIEGQGGDYSCGYYNNSICRSTDRWLNSPKGGSAATQLTWQQVYADMSVDYQAYYLRYKIFYDSNDYYQWADATVQPRVTANYKDTRMDAVCKAAKDEGVIVFAIGFSVDSTDGNKLKKCASSDAHYYDVNGLEITTAFQSIANAIGKLRLTQ